MATKALPTSRQLKTPSLPILRARLSAPQAGERNLDRPRLMETLAANAMRPLTLVVADAGFGKTSLLGAFARKLLRPVVWYTLMPSDADPAVFGRYLLEGFRRDAPRFGRDFERALDDSRPGARSAEMLAGTLANDLATLKGPTRLLVLDDYQEVTAHRGVIAFTETLLRHLPNTVRILMAARATPPLSLDRMRSTGEVFELQSSHLRFTREEISRLFSEIYRRPLAGSELIALDEATLGWPTAVHLVHEALRRDDAIGLEEVLADVRSSQLEMHDYLSSEVYARLDADSRTVLDRTAVLERFTIPIASALTGLAGVQGVLDGLSKRGLLRAFGHGSGISYECHDLVRGFIRQELETTRGADGIREFEAAAAAILAARGEPERALRHWLRAGRAPDAAAALRELAPGLLRLGRAAALKGYLDELPAETIRGDASLLLALADAQQALGDWDAAETSYQDLLDRRHAPDRELECRALLGLGKVLNLRGRHEHVLGMAERGLATAQRLDPALRARLLQMKAGAHFYLGQYAASVEVLDRVRELLRDTADTDLLLPTIHNLAGAYAAMGKFREASNEFRVALAQVRGTSSPRAPLYLSNLAFHLAELGELAEARRAAEEGLAAAQRFSNRAQECICQQALAQVLAQSGDTDASLAALKRAQELNADLRIEVIETDLLLLHGRVFLMRGQSRRAVEFVSQAIDRLRARPEDPRLGDAQAALAWCELRAGRLHVARELLEALVPRADAGENEYLRMRVHYWLGETLLALGEKRGIDAHAQLALRLVREHGYGYFLAVQAREDAQFPLHALERGIEAGTVASALVEGAAHLEPPLLEMLRRVPTRLGETIVAVLAEVGGPTALDALTDLARARRALQPSIASATRQIRRRLERGSAAPGASSTPAVRLALFGAPQLRIDARVLPASAWRTQRAFQMLVYLALNPRGVEREVLIDRFWPGRQAAAGRRNLHPTLSYIRSVLPRAPVAPILREGGRYALNTAYPMTCDHWDLDRAADEARRTRDSAEKRAALEHAVEIASGPFLDGFYADWADELRARDHDRMEKLLLELGAQCLSVDDFESALIHFRRALELDAYREGTCLAVMECQIRLGNRRAAMVEYERLKTALRTELRVDPLPETEEAVRRLLGLEGPGRAPARGGVIDIERIVPQPVARSAQVRVKAARGALPQ